MSSDNEEESSSTSGEESGYDIFNGGPKSKKNDAKKAKIAKSSPQKSKSSDGTLFMAELSKRKRCRVTEFRGTKYVDFREYYEKDGEWLPGKKGLMLNKSEWEKVKQAIKQIDKDFE